MRILRREERLVRLRVENPDDVWALRAVIEPGDELRASTERKVRIGSGKEEKSAVTRRRMTLTVRAEKAEYSADGGSLRVLGIITDGPDDVPRGEHHSLVLEPGVEVAVTKEEWPAYQLRRLEEATRQDAALLVLLFDREEAKLYAVTRRGIEEVARLKGVVRKKGADDAATRNFYAELVAELEARQEKYQHVVAAAPAFWKEYLERELPAALKKKTVVTTISAVERTAIRELLSRPEVERVLERSSTMRELGLVERAMEALGRERLAYGREAVKEAVATGNVAQLLVTENAIAQARDEERFPALEALLKGCEAARGEVHVLGADEAMEKVDGLGGVVAVRRW